MVAEAVVGGVEGAAGGAVDEQVVGGDVEGLGELDHHVDGGADLAGLVAADLAGVSAKPGGELAL